jgi:hypothetical protein
VLAACGKSSEAPKKEPVKPVASPEAVPPVDAAVRAKKVFVHGSARCAECHEKMFEEWKPSSHAHAASSPLYLAARKNAGNEQCGARCHTPLASALGETDPVAAEGITCDVCHTLRDPKPSAKGGDFTLAIDDMVKFGPRCDLEDHYFHRMGCSKEHATAQICGSCHWWERKGIPVFTEYKDFMATDDAQKGVVCQDCHMPAERGALAEGSPVRPDVKHHGLLGLANDLRARMLAVEVSVKAVPPQLDGSIVDGVHVEITVTNVIAAHYIPSGLPERRIEVRAKVVDDKDAAKNVGKTWALGRHLGNDKDEFAPFWRATKVVEDTRIPPGGVWKGGPWQSSAPNSGRVVVEVAYRGLADEAATLLGVTDVEEQILATLEVPFGAPTGSANRAKLPKTVTFVPPSPGKRTAPKQKANAP